MKPFRVHITYTSESESQASAGHENVLGGIEYRIDGENIINPDTDRSPSSMDYLGMALQSLLRACSELLDGEPGYVAYHESEAYLVFVPMSDQTIRVGVSTKSWEEATEHAPIGQEISLETFVDEALAAGTQYLDWVEQQETAYRTRTYSKRVTDLLVQVRQRRDESRNR